MQKVTRRTLLASVGLVALLNVFDLTDLTGRDLPVEGDATWDLTQIYVSDAQWESARQLVMKQLPSLAAYRGKLGASASTLFGALILISDLRRSILRLDTYATLLSDQDMRVSANQMKRQLASDLFGQLDQATAWVLPEVIALGPTRMTELVHSDARLNRFSFALADMLRQTAHTLPAEEEVLLAAAGTPLSAPAAIQREIVTSRIAPPDVTLSDGRSTPVDDKALASVPTFAARADRKTVSDAYWSSFSKLQGALGATLNASIQADLFNARSRHFKNSLQASLFNLNIPVDAYTTMLAEVNSALPVLHRYYELRRRVLGFSDLQPYDLSVPLATIGTKFSLTEIRTLTLEALRPLGPDYGSKLASATKARWMDAFTHPGKRPGGYSNSGAYDLHPYVLLNVTSSYAGATAFAHEWGHAMHAVLAAATQPFETSNAPPFMQEVASTCNEQLLVNYMLRSATTKQEKLFYLGQQMENFASVFFRQAMKAEFEASLHEASEKGQDLSGEQMTEMYRTLLLRYYGTSVHVDTHYATEWGRQPQYYNAFYIFQYVIAIAGAVFFSRSILHGGSTERDSYLGMLRQGGSNYGYEVLRSAGMDLANPMVYRNVIREFTTSMDRADALLS